MNYMIYTTVYFLVTLAFPFCLGYWYGYEKGKADGFERK
jgi:hypothetical protein